MAVLISTWWSVCPIHQHCLDGLHDDDEASDGDDNAVALASCDHQNHGNYIIYESTGSVKTQNCASAHDSSANVPSAHVSLIANALSAQRRRSKSGSIIVDAV